MKKHYVQAILELLEAGHSVAEILKGLERTLKEHGHESLYRPVLEAVVRVLEAKKPDTIVYVAAESHLKQQSQSIRAVLAELEAAKDHAVSIDPSLIGGFIVEHDHQRVDGSYKSALLSLYRSLTT